jgi:hypothetical protein
LAVDVQIVDRAPKAIRENVVLMDCKGHPVLRENQAPEVIQEKEAKMVSLVDQVFPDCLEKTVMMGHQDPRENEERTLLLTGIL